jgi:lysophospholipase L1-like esterase
VNAPQAKPGLAAKLLLSLGALTAALLAGECTVRVAGLAPEVAALDVGRYRLSQNPKIGFEPVPGMSYAAAPPPEVLAGKKEGEERYMAEARYVNTQFYDYRDQANRLGYRDVDHEVTKPPGRYRVVVLGDSIASGLFVSEYALTFPAVLERALKAAGKDAEVISFAVNGYNTQQEVETLVDRGLVYQPDAVVVGYCHNDRRQVDGGIMPKLIEANGGRPPSSALGGWLVKRSALVRLLWYRLGAGAQPLPEKYKSLAVDTVDASLEKLAGLARTHGFTVTLAVFPNFGYDMHKETAVMEALSKRLGFTFIDLLPRFQACDRTAGKQNIDRWHLRPGGHTCSGEAVAESLLGASAAGLR